MIDYPFKNADRIPIDFTYVQTLLPSHTDEVERIRQRMNFTFSLTSKFEMYIAKDK